VLESVFEKKKRVRPPRVNITYEVEIGGAQVLKELDRDNFDDVLKSMKPRVALRVDNTLKGDGSELSVELKFEKLSDFEPEAIVRQVEPLRKLLEVRGQLKDLQSRTEGNDRLEEMLNEIIDNEALRTKMKDATGAGAAVSEGERNDG
jgi:type VI secretion system protein ImpB